MSVTSGQQILLPESTRKQRKERRVTLAINSRDRNTVSYTHSNNFRWVLPRPLKDIVSIELMNGCIPADIYNVNTEWNKFTFGEDTPSTWNVALTPGQYTPTTLATELQTQLNSLGAANTYSVGFSDSTKKLTIHATAGTAIFTLFFATGTFTDTIDSYNGAINNIRCPARLLGFDTLKDYVSNSSNVLVSPFRVDTDYCIKRLYLHVNVDNSIELNRIEMGGGRRSCFHIIYMNNTTNGYYYLNTDVYMPVYYSAPAPIARIASLNISLRDEFFRPVDLGNHDYTLIFEITVLD